VSLVGRGVGADGSLCGGRWAGLRGARGARGPGAGVVRWHTYSARGGCSLGGGRTKWGHTARLETRTKECSEHASIRVGSLGADRNGGILSPCEGVQGWQAGLWSTASLEHGCCDPKDGELCLGRMKPGETLVEVQSGSDVQIDHGTWV
jgi:hypothetical protein